jgi:hypothetical protein
MFDTALNDQFPAGAAAYAAYADGGIGRVRDLLTPRAEKHNARGSRHR